MPSRRITPVAIAALAGAVAIGALTAVLDLKTGQRKTLVRGASQAEYVDPSGGAEQTGYLICAAAGTLRAVRFDPARLEVLGDPVTVGPGDDQADRVDLSASQCCPSSSRRDTAVERGAFRVIGLLVLGAALYVVKRGPWLTGFAVLLALLTSARTRRRCSPFLPGRSCRSSSRSATFRRRRPRSSATS